MTKELQDLVWSILPKEFKEEVKKVYQKLQEQRKECDRLHFDNARAKVQERIVILQYFFGEHNLTSDAEGEEMLTCEKNRVQQQYKRASILKDDSDPKWELVGDQIERVLIGLFGSKCLPDIEPKPAEPKFKVGDELVWDKRIIVKVDEVYADGEYLVYSRVGNRYTVKESDLEPYTEPKFKVDDYVWYRGEVRKVAATTENNRYYLTGITESVSASDLEYLEHYQQPFSKVKEYAAYDSNGIDRFGQQFDGTSIAAHGKTDDHIADAGKMMRLNIAATIMAGLYSNNFIVKNNYMDDIVKVALDATDSLIAEAEKGVVK